MDIYSEYLSISKDLILAEKDKVDLYKIFHSMYDIDKKKKKQASDYSLSDYVSKGIEIKKSHLKMLDRLYTIMDSAPNDRGDSCIAQIPYNELIEMLLAKEKSIFNNINLVNNFYDKLTQ